MVKKMWNNLKLKWFTFLRKRLKNKKELSLDILSLRERQTEERNQRLLRQKSEILEAKTAEEREKKEEKLKLAFRKKRQTLRRQLQKLESEKKAGRLSDAGYAAVASNIDKEIEQEKEKLKSTLSAVKSLPDTKFETAGNEQEKQQKEVLAERNKAKLSALRAKTEVKQQKYAQKIAVLTEKIHALSVADTTEQLPEGSVLKVEELSMYFGGLKAVDNLSFEVKKGEIFGLIGPNGAGKTTVFNCITQFYKFNHGKIIYRTKQDDIIDLKNFKVHDVIRHGLVRTFQNVELVWELSVLDNLLVAAHTQFKSNLFVQMLHLPILKSEELIVRAKAVKVLDYLNLTPYAHFIVAGLPYGVRKKIELARTLMANPQLIILDEPAAGLNESETRELAALIRKIRKDYDTTVLLVEHDMGLVMDVCDRICAISFGKLLAVGTPSQIQQNKTVQQAYLGVDE